MLDKLLEYNAELHPILHFIISYDNNKVKNVNFSVHKKITLKNNIVRTLNQLNINAKSKAS